MAVLEMVKTTIENLGLTGIRDGMVEITKNWKGDDEPLTTNNGIVIGTSTERLMEGNNEQWEIDYPAVIVFGQGNANAGDENLDLITEWRQEIHKAFDFKREPQEQYLEDDEVVKDLCRVQFGPGWLDEAWKKNWDSSSMVVWTRLFVTRFP
jgi:hypothetical protein